MFFFFFALHFFLLSIPLSFRPLFSTAPPPSTASSLPRASFSSFYAVTLAALSSGFRISNASSPSA